MHPAVFTFVSSTKSYHPMAVIFILVSVSVAVAAFFLLLFIRAVRSGQYEDEYSPSVRILFDADDTTSNKNKQTS